MLLKRLALSISLSSAFVGGANHAHAAESLGTTLEDFFTAALNFSPALKAAEARWQGGDARVAYATGQLLPQLNASANSSDNTRQENGRLEQDYRGRNRSVQLTQVLFNWQAFAGRKQASLQENQMEAEYFVELAKLLSEVADRYLTVLQSEDALASMDAELEAITNQVNQLNRLYGLQLAKVTDLYHAQAQQAAVLSQRIVADSELNISREALRANTGIGVGGLNRLPESINVTPLQGLLDKWLASASANNKSIEAGNFALQAADKAVDVRRGAYMPRVSLVVQHQNSDLGFQNAPVNRADNNYIGVDVSVPLFAGGSNRALVREAQSQRTVAENQVKQISLDVLNRVRTAYFQVKAGEARIESSRLLAEATATSYQAMQRSYELGTETSVNVLNALRDQFRAQRDLQKARYDLIRSTLVLEREAGTLDADDMRQVSSQLNTTPAQ